MREVCKTPPFPPLLLAPKGTPAAGPRGSEELGKKERMKERKIENERDRERAESVGKDGKLFVFCRDFLVTNV